MASGGIGYSPSSPATPSSSTPATTTNTGIPSFRSLRSLLPFGPNKVATPVASSVAPPQPSTPSRSPFTSNPFGSVRRSIQKERAVALDRERKVSLSNDAVMSPVIAIGPTAGDDEMGDTPVRRRSVSLSRLERLDKPLPEQPPLSPLDASFTLPSSSNSSSFHSQHQRKEPESLATLFSLPTPTPGPTLSAELSTIIEADTSGVSRHVPLLDSIPDTSSTDQNHQYPSKESNGVPGHTHIRHLSTATATTSTSLNLSLATAPPDNENPDFADDDDFDPDASALHLSTSDLDTQVRDAFRKSASSAEDKWRDAGKAVVIDATGRDVGGRGTVDFNMDDVDPDLAALLSPNSMSTNTLNHRQDSTQLPTSSLGPSSSSSVPSSSTTIPTPATPTSPSTSTSNPHPTPGGMSRVRQASSFLPRLRPSDHSSSSPLASPSSPRFFPSRSNGQTTPQLAVNGKSVPGPGTPPTPPSVPPRSPARQGLSISTGSGSSAGGNGGPTNPLTPSTPGSRRFGVFSGNGQNRNVTPSTPGSTMSRSTEDRGDEEGRHYQHHQPETPMSTASATTPTNAKSTSVSTPIASTTPSTPSTSNNRQPSRTFRQVIQGMGIGVGGMTRSASVHAMGAAWNQPSTPSNQYSRPQGPGQHYRHASASTSNLAMYSQQQQGGARGSLDGRRWGAPQQQQNQQELGLGRPSLDSRLGSGGGQQREYAFGVPVQSLAPTDANGAPTLGIVPVTPVGPGHGHGREGTGGSASIGLGAPSPSPSPAPSSVSGSVGYAPQTPTGPGHGHGHSQLHGAQMLGGAGGGRRSFDARTFNGGGNGGGGGNVRPGTGGSYGTTGSSSVRGSQRGSSSPERVAAGERERFREREREREGRASMSDLPVDEFGNVGMGGRARPSFDGNAATLRPGSRTGSVSALRARDRDREQALAMMGGGGTPRSASTVALVSPNGNANLSGASSSSGRVRKRSMSVQLGGIRDRMRAAVGGGGGGNGTPTQGSNGGSMRPGSSLSHHGGNTPGSGSGPGKLELLGPRTAKAFRAAGLLDFENDRREASSSSARGQSPGPGTASPHTPTNHPHLHHHPHHPQAPSSASSTLGPNDTTIIAPSPLSAVSSSASAASPVSASALNRFALTQHRSASEYNLLSTRSHSRLAFSDAGGGGSGNGAPGRRGSGTFSAWGGGYMASRFNGDASSASGGPGLHSGAGLMESPTFTMTTSSSSRDTPRSMSNSGGGASSSASTNHTGATSLSDAFGYFGPRERDAMANREREHQNELAVLKDKHSTEMGALLSALSDSQRTARMLREENGQLRDRMGDTESVVVLKAENERLRRMVEELREECDMLRREVQSSSDGGSVGRRANGGSGGSTSASTSSGWRTPSHGLSAPGLTPSWSMGSSGSSLSGPSTSGYRTPIPSGKGGGSNGGSPLVRSFTPRFVQNQQQQHQHQGPHQHQPSYQDDHLAPPSHHSSDLHTRKDSISVPPVPTLQHDDQGTVYDATFLDHGEPSFDLSIETETGRRRDDTDDDDDDDPHANLTGGKTMEELLPPSSNAPSLRKRASDTSSIFPVVPANMTMLLHDDLLSDGNKSSTDHSHYPTRSMLPPPKMASGNSAGATGSLTGPSPVVREIQAHSRSHSLSQSPALSYQAFITGQSQSHHSHHPSLSSRSHSRHNSQQSYRHHHATSSISASTTTPLHQANSSAISISPTTANFSMTGTGSPGSLFLKPEHEMLLGDMESLDLGVRAEIDLQALALGLGEGPRDGDGW